MSRVTPAVQKLTYAIRGISSSARAARPSGLLNSQTGSYLPRRLTDLKAECGRRRLPTSGSKAELVERLAAFDLTRQHSTLIGGHRPTALAVAAAPGPTFRFMQGFTTSAPRAAAHDTSSIDFAFLPAFGQLQAGDEGRIRVPLLPDNYAPDRTLYAVEAADRAIPAPEIHRISSHPEEVHPAALTEIVGHLGEEMQIGELTKAFDKVELVVGDGASEAQVEGTEPGTLRQLWNGFVDDVFGGQATGRKAAF